MDEVYVKSVLQRHKEHSIERSIVFTLGKSMTSIELRVALGLGQHKLEGRVNLPDKWRRPTDCGARFVVHWIK
jgi:hypothetical protein